MLGKILEDTVNNEKITAEVRKLQPAYKMIKGSRTVIRIEVEIAKRIGKQQYRKRVKHYRVLLMLRSITS